MQLIPLTKGKFAKVDNKDFEKLEGLRWKVHINYSKYYAIRYKVINGKKKTIFMHREIMPCEDHLVIDHINHDGLDNRRINLRICTKSENRKNCRNRPEPCY